MRFGLLPRWMMQAILLLLLATALVSGGYWWGTRESRPARGADAAHRIPHGHEHETSSALLTELITRDMSLRTPGLTEWDRVNRIRDWAHANIDLATTRYLLDQDASFKFFSRTAPEIFTAFFDDRGGVWCGGAAYVLMELYKLFGFRASIVDFGRSDVTTHVVTLVEIDSGGRQKTVVQDATFNVTYVTKASDPLDYFELLAVLMRHGHQSVGILAGRRRGGTALVDPRDDQRQFGHIVDFGTQPVHVLPNGVKKYRSRLSLETYEEQFGERIRAFLRKEGHPERMLYLYLYPLAASDAAVLSEAQRLTKQERGATVRDRRQSVSAR